MNKHYAFYSPFKMKDSKGNEYTLTVEQDDYAEDPREWDNLCTMICWHHDYSLGDKHKYDDSDEFMNYILHKVCGMEYEDFEELPTREKYKLICESDKVYIKKINLYDHSGITVSTSENYPYNDRWDSSRVGFIYVTKERVLKEIANADEVNWTAIADEYIEDEMETYDDYLRGNVYSWTLIKKVVKQDKCPHCGEVIREYEDEEEVDSCGGYYGNCLEENGILSDMDNDLEFVED